MSNYERLALWAVCGFCAGMIFERLVDLLTLDVCRCCGGQKWKCRALINACCHWAPPPDILIEEPHSKGGINQGGSAFPTMFEKELKGERVLRMPVEVLQGSSPSSAEVRHQKDGCISSPEQDANNGAPDSKDATPSLNAAEEAPDVDGDEVIATPPSTSKSLTSPVFSAEAVLSPNSEIEASATPGEATNGEETTPPAGSEEYGSPTSAEEVSSASSEKATLTTSGKVSAPSIVAEEAGSSATAEDFMRGEETRPPVCSEDNESSIDAEEVSSVSSEKATLATSEKEVLASSMLGDEVASNSEKTGSSVTPEEATCDNKTRPSTGSEELRLSVGAEEVIPSASSGEFTSTADV